jgi:hypothetical protein
LLRFTRANKGGRVMRRDPIRARFITQSATAATNRPYSPEAWPPPKVAAICDVVLTPPAILCFAAGQQDAVASFRQ